MHVRWLLHPGAPAAEAVLTPTFRAEAGEECPTRISGRPATRLSRVGTNGSDDVLARAADLPIALAALAAAKRMCPKDVLEYRCGAPALERSEAP